jgi:hypothetical protein
VSHVKARVVTVLLLGLLTACSSAVDGSPRGSGPATGDHVDGTADGTADSPVVRRPKKADTIDCTGLTQAAVDATHQPSATVDTTTTPDECHLSAGTLAVRVALHKRPQGEKTKDFQGNTAFSASVRTGHCAMGVALAKDSWLDVTVQSSGDNDTCAAASALLKSAFDKLPNA